jgi:hypothetical protein
MLWQSTVVTISSCGSQQLWQSVVVTVNSCGNEQLWQSVVEAINSCGSQQTLTPLSPVMICWVGMVGTASPIVGSYCVLGYCGRD